MTRDGGNASSGEAAKVSTTRLVFPVLLSACLETDEEMEKTTERNGAHYTKCWISRTNYILGKELLNSTV